MTKPDIDLFSLHRHNNPSCAAVKNRQNLAFFSNFLDFHAKPLSFLKFSTVGGSVEQGT